jgi:HEAT repeat protein
MERLTTDSIGRIGVHAVGAMITALGWFFREQPTSDFGIDAQAEAPNKGGYPSGRLLGLQIKTGKRWFQERDAEGIVYRGSLRHLAYWTEHSLPVVLILYDPQDRTCLWVHINEKAIEPTARGWKILVPFDQKLDPVALHAWSYFCVSDGAKDPFSPASVGDTPRENSILRFATAYCDIGLRKVGRRYRPELYVPRLPDEVVWKWLTDPAASRARCRVILERAGSGKTNLTCHMARRLLGAGHPCALLLGSESLDNRSGLAVQAVRAFGFDPESFGGHLLLAVQELGDAVYKTPLCILIDAINEARDVELMQNAIAELLAQFRDLPVRILISCRDIYWQFMSGDWVDIIPSEVQSLNLYKYDTDTWPTVRDRYLSAFKIRGSLSGDAEEKCRHPLLFRFFCEAYENEDIEEVTQIRLKPLFERYLQKKVERVAVESHTLFRAQEIITRTLEAIAGEILTTREVSVSEERIAELTREPTDFRRDSIHVRLLDEDIILGEVPDASSSRLLRRIRFVYEAFLEFMLAREMSRRWAEKTNEEVIEDLVHFLEPSACLRNTLGALSFLGDFFVERNLSPWLVLAERGRVWQRLVLSSLRESDIEEIDALYKDVFPALLVAEDFETRTGAIELLEEPEARRVLDPKCELLLDRFRSDKRREVRLAALKILSQIWDEIGSEERLQIVMAVLDPSTAIREEALGLVSDLASKERKRLFGELVSKLESHSGRTRSYATMALRLKHWSGARPHLLNCLQDPNAWVRSASLIQLLDFPQLVDLERILPLLTDGEPRVRSLAAILSGRWGYAESLPSLLERIEVETDETVLSRIVEAVIAIDSPHKSDLIPLFRSLLNHKNYWVRSHAGTGLFSLQGLHCLDDLVYSIVQKPPVGGWFKGWPGIADLGDRSGIIKLCQSDFVSSEFSQKSGAFVAGVFTPLVGGEHPEWRELIEWLSIGIRGLPVAAAEHYFQGLRICRTSNLYYFFNQPDARAVLSDLLLSGPAHLQSHACFLTAAFAGPLSAVELEHVFSHPSVTLRENLAWGIERSSSYQNLASVLMLEHSPKSDLNDDLDIPF